MGLIGFLNNPFLGGRPGSASPTVSFCAKRSWSIRRVARMRISMASASICTGNKLIDMSALVRMIDARDDEIRGDKILARFNAEEATRNKFAQGI